ncbi:hypothetical protein C4D60_Mb09t09370 [Musa balbisiana]|uniref:Uncharacterized protein n=1 Tax=Musa balbisiana TaxID=52838 RepID=A0A4S8IFX8_MUSBA|nr:hypothetical protein C4D60_Mb09t09370 [Musa balbisiana]
MHEKGAPWLDQGWLQWGKPHSATTTKTSDMMFVMQHETYKTSTSHSKPQFLLPSKQFSQQPPRP